MVAKDFSTVSMIALVVPEPETYAINPPAEGTLSPEDLHITLAYLGDISEINDEQRAAILDAAETLANTSQAPEALFPATSGVFPPDPESTDGTSDVPYYAAPANPERFNDLREDLMIHMGSRGVGEFVKTKHPVFSPHVTLAYAPLDTPPDLSHLPTPLPTTFSTLIVTFGDEVHEFQLSTPETGPELPITASVRAQISKLSNEVEASEDYLTALYLRQRNVRSTPCKTRAQAALDQVVASIDATYRADSYARVKELQTRIHVEPDPAARAFLAARALALTARTPIPTTTQEAREFSALTASFTSLLADGNSSVARSLRAKKQLRDRYGRWIEQGGGVRFKIRVPGAPGGGTWYHGTVEGFDIPAKRVIVKLQDGRTVKIPNDKIEQPKAILGLNPTKKLKTFVPKSRDRITDITSPKHVAKVEKNANQDALDEAAVQSMDNLKEQMQDFASTDVTGGHITRYADSEHIRDAVTKADADGAATISEAGNVAPFKEKPALASVQDLKTVQAALDARIQSALPDDYDSLDPDAQKKAFSSARGKAIAGLGGLSNDSKDANTKALRKAPSVGTDKDLEEVAPEDVLGASSTPDVGHDEAIQAAEDALAELKDRVSDDSGLAKYRDRIENSLKTANDRLNSGEDDFETYLGNLDKIKDFANKQDPGTKNSSDEHQAFSSFAEDIDDIHAAAGGTDDFNDVQILMTQISDEIQKASEVEDDQGPIGMHQGLLDAQETVDKVFRKVAAGDYLDDPASIGKDLSDVKETLDDAVLDEDAVDDINTQLDALIAKNPSAEPAEAPASPETPEEPTDSEIEIPGDPADYTDAPDDATDLEMSAFSAFSDATGAIYDITVNDKHENNVEGFSQDTQDSLGDLQDALNQWYINSTNPEPDLDELKALAGEISVHSSALFDSLSAEKFDSDKVDALSKALTDLVDATDDWYNGTKGGSVPKSTVEPVDAPEFKDFADIYMQLNDFHDDLPEDGTFANEIAAFGNTVANVGRELTQGKITHTEASELLGNLLDEIGVSAGKADIEPSMLDSLTDVTGEIHDIKAALDNLDSLPDPDDPETPDTEVEGISDQEEFAGAWANMPDIESTVSEILDESPKDVVTTAAPELEEPLADWEKELLGILDKQGDPAEAIQDAINAGDRYHAALENVSDADETTPDAKAVAAGEADRVLKANSDLADAAEADGITSEDPAPLVPDNANQAIIDQLNAQGSPIAKVIAQHLQDKVDAGEPLTEDDYTAIKGLIDFVAPAEENSAEDTADFINVSDALDPQVAPTDVDVQDYGDQIDAATSADALEALATAITTDGTQKLGVFGYNQFMKKLDAKYKDITGNSISSYLEGTDAPEPTGVPEAPTPEPLPVFDTSGSFDPATLVSMYNAPDAQKIDQALNTWEDQLIKYLDDNGSEGAVTPKEGATWNPLTEAQHKNLQGIISNLPDELSGPLQDAYDKHTSVGITDDELVQAISTTLLDLPWNSKARTQLKGAQAGIQTNTAPLVPILRPKPAAYGKGKEFTADELALPSPSQVKGSINAVIAQSAAGADLKHITGGDGSTDDQVKTHIADAEMHLTNAIDQFNEGGVEQMINSMHDALMSYDAAIALRNTVHKNDKIVRRLRARRRALDEVLAPFEARWPDPVNGGTYQKYSGGYDYNNGTSHTDKDGNDVYPGDQIERTHKTAKGQTAMVLGWRGDESTGYQAHLWLDQEKKDRPQGVAQNQFVISAVGPNNPLYHDPDFTGKKVGEDIYSEFDTEQKKKIANQAKKASKAPAAPEPEAVTPEATPVDEDPFGDGSTVDEYVAEVWGEVLDDISGNSFGEEVIMDHQNTVKKYISEQFYKTVHPADAAEDVTTQPYDFWTTKQEEYGTDDSIPDEPTVDPAEIASQLDALEKKAASPEAPTDPSGDVSSWTTGINNKIVTVSHDDHNAVIKFTIVGDNGTSNYFDKEEALHAILEQEGSTDENLAGPDVIEKLKALPVGTKIDVQADEISGSGIWTKDEQGWIHANGDGVVTNYFDDPDIESIHVVNDPTDPDVSDVTDEDFAEVDSYNKAVDAIEAADSAEELDILKQAVVDNNNLYGKLEEELLDKINEKLNSLNETPTDSSSLLGNPGTLAKKLDAAPTGTTLEGVWADGGGSVTFTKLDDGNWAYPTNGGWTDSASSVGVANGDFTSLKFADAPTTSDNPFTPLPSGETGKSGDKWVTVNGKQKWGRYGASGIAVTAVDPADGKTKVLLGKRGDRDEWYLPGGALDEKETPVQGATREFIEEANEGSDIAQNLSLVSENKNVVGPILGTDGEEWAYTTVHASLPETADITVPDSADPAELAEYKWVDADELSKMDSDGVLHPAMSNGVFSDIIGFTDGGNTKMDNASIAPADLASPTYDISGWKKVGGSLGTQSANVMQDPDGNKYYVKKAQSPDHAQNEILASSLYQTLGIKSVDSKLGTDSQGNQHIVTPWIEGSDASALADAVHTKDQEFINKVRENFAIDAWLGNYDVIGPNYSNIISDGDGNPVRVDNGAALLFRGTGSKKHWWGSDPVDFDDMRQGSSKSGTYSTAKKIFGGMTDEQLNASAAKLLDISKSDIAALVNSTGFDDKTKKKLTDDLIARRHSILDKYNLTKDSKNKDLADEPGWVQSVDINKAQQASAPVYTDGQKVVSHDGKPATISQLMPDGWLLVRYDSNPDTKVLTHIDDIKPINEAGPEAEGGAVHIFTKHGMDYDAGDAVAAFDSESGWITGTLGSTPVFESSGDQYADITDSDGNQHLVPISSIVPSSAYEKIADNNDSGQVLEPSTPDASQSLGEGYAPLPAGAEPLFVRKGDKTVIVQHSDGMLYSYKKDGTVIESPTQTAEPFAGSVLYDYWEPAEGVEEKVDTPSVSEMLPFGYAPIPEGSKLIGKSISTDPAYLVLDATGGLKVHYPGGAVNSTIGTVDDFLKNSDVWEPAGEGQAPEKPTIAPATLPPGFAPLPEGSTPLLQHIGGNILVQHADGSLHVYKTDGSTNTPANQDLGPFEETPEWDHPFAATPSSAPSTPTGPLSAENKPLQVGDAVQIIKGNHKGKPTKGIITGFDPNGNAKLKLYTDEGAPATIQGKGQLKSLVKPSSLKHQNTDNVTPENPTGGETTPTPQAIPQTGTPQPKTEGLPTGITLSEGDPSSPLYDTPAPTPPVAPNSVSGKFVGDDWEARAEAAYKAYNEKKSPGSGASKVLAQSSYYNTHYKKAMAGDESGLTFLKDKGYFDSDPALYQDALDASVEGKKNAAAQIADFQKKQADFQLQQQAWLAANGKAFYTPLDPKTVQGKSYSAAHAWMKKKFEGKIDKLSSKARAGLVAQKHSSSWQTAIRLINKTIGMRREDVAAVSSPHGMEVWDQVKQAADEAGPVGEAWKGIRTVTVDRFANISGVTLKNGDDLTQIIGTIQKDHGGMEFTPGDLDNGGKQGYVSGQVIMNLTVPPEIKGVYTGGADFPHAGEHGFIAEPGLAMYIWDVKPGPGNFAWRVDASLIPREVLPYMNNFQGGPGDHPIVIPGAPLPDGYKPKGLIEGETYTDPKDVVDKTSTTPDPNGLIEGGEIQ